jgi:hypothetical protein
MDIANELWKRQVSTSGHAHWPDDVTQDDRPNVEHLGNARTDYVPRAGNGRHDPESVTIAGIEQVNVETQDGRLIPLGDILSGQILLYLVDDDSIARSRRVAEIAWIQERLSQDVKFVLVWKRRPVKHGRPLPARDGTYHVIDTSGQLRGLLESAGIRRALVVDTEAGTVMGANKESDVFSLGREIRVTDARGNDHVIDLGDLT